MSSKTSNQYSPSDVEGLTSLVDLLKPDVDADRCPVRALVLAVSGQMSDVLTELQDSEADIVYLSKQLHAHRELLEGICLAMAESVAEYQFHYSKKSAL